MRIIYISITIIILAGSFIYLNQNQKLVIDPNIKVEVENRVSGTVSKRDLLCGIEYQTQHEFQFFVNDTLREDACNSTLKASFVTDWTSGEGSIGISGTFAGSGHGGHGFIISILNNEAEISSHMATHMGVGFSKTANGELESSLVLKCDDSKVILSEFPNSEKTDTLFGMVEYHTEEFYQPEYGENEEDVKWDRLKLNAKFYFKAIRCEM